MMNQYRKAKCAESLLLSVFDFSATLHLGIVFVIYCTLCYNKEHASELGLHWSRNKNVCIN